MRIWIYSLCIVGLVNSFMHYGLMNPYNKSKTFVFIEIFRSSVFFGMCFYYSERATKLIKKKRSIVTSLKVIYFAILGGCIALGIFIAIRIDQYSEGNTSALDPYNLCTALEFEIFRWLPLGLCAIF